MGSRCQWVPFPALWLRSFFLADKKQSDKGAQEEVRVRCNSEDNPPPPVPAVAYFLQLGPYSFCHLSIKPPYEDSIKILIY